MSHIEPRSVEFWPNTFCFSFAVSVVHHGGTRTDHPERRPRHRLGDVVAERHPAPDPGKVGAHLQQDTLSAAKASRSVATARMIMHER